MAWLAMLLGVGLAVAPTAPAQPTTSFVYELHVDCPELDALFDTNSLVCPVRAVDPDDIMGSPSVAVDPADPTNLIIASLHGGDADGPTQRSRNIQPFTTFVSSDHGASWTDNPYYPPSSLQGSFGEHAQVTTDAAGRVYIASLYSTPDAHAVSGFTYTLVAQKFSDLFQVNARQGGNGDWRAQFLEPYYTDSVVPQFWMLHDNDTAVTTLLWLERLPQPSPPGSMGQRAAPSQDGGRSVLGMAWTSPRGSEPYHYVDDDLLVGPCADASNPVLAAGFIYVACVVDAQEGGFAWSDTVVDGQIEIFRLEPLTGAPTHLGRAPVSGGHPMLGVRGDGKVVIASAGAGPDGNTRLVLSWGQLDNQTGTISWDHSQSIGDDLSPARTATTVRDAKIQALRFREDSGAVHLILKERFQTQGLRLDDLDSLLQPEYRKRLVAIDEDRAILASIDLDVGNPVNRTSFAGRQDPSDPNSVFNDLTDDLVLFEPGQFPPSAEWAQRIGEYKADTYQREFFAVADYGVIQFAEVIEITDLAPPLAINPAGVVPVASIALNPATLGLTVLGTALTGLFALKLALTRTSTAAASVSRGGK